MFKKRDVIKVNSSLWGADTKEIKRKEIILLVSLWHWLLLSLFADCFPVSKCRMSLGFRDPFIDIHFIVDGTQSCYFKILYYVATCPCIASGPRAQR